MTAEPFIAYQDEWLTLYQGDCRRVMVGYADPNYDAVITDPPRLSRMARRPAGLGHDCGGRS